MKKKFFLSVIFTLNVVFSVFSQTLCDTGVDAGEDVTICQGNCTDLQAVVNIGQMSEGYDTSAYVIYHDYCVPQPESETPTYIMGDDDWTGAIDIGFDFDFFGNTYNQLLIGDNGVITFDLSEANGYCPWSFSETIPNTGFPIKNAIFGAYHDLYTPAAPNPGVVISYYLSGSAPFRTFVVNYSEVPQYFCNDLLTTQQIVLYETSNIIVVNITEKPVCTDWQDGVAVVGVMNAAGTIAYVPGPDTTPAGEDPYPNRNTGAWEITPDNSESWQFVPIGLNFPDYTFTWYDADGNVISNDEQITVCPEEDTFYKAELIVGDFMPVTDTVNVTVTPNPAVATQPDDMLMCSNTPGEYSASFDLTAQDYVITGGTENTSVSYYLSEEDANNGTNPLSSPYLSTEPVQTIYARLDPDEGECYDITSFEIQISTIEAQEVSSGGCAIEPGSSEMEINLTQFDADISGGAGDATVTYYTNQADADAGENAIGSTYTGPTTTLYARVENSNGCYDTAPLNLTIHPMPQAMPVDEILVCNEGNSTGIYDLNPVIEQAAGDQENLSVSIFQSLEDAMNAENALELTDVSLTAPRTLYIRVENEFGCADYGTVDLKIHNCPPVIPNTFTPNDDGVNDEFTIHRLKTIYEDYHLRIYNRWGNLVYEGGPDDPFWDGKVDGGVLTNDPSGTVYFYVLELNDGENKPVKGTIYVKP